MRKILFNVKFLIIATVLLFANVIAEATYSTEAITPQQGLILFGKASFYADHFHGKKTANGEIYQKDELTAACNSLPLGTWIKVTNLSNGKNVIVKTNDRLHKSMNRLVDLSKVAASKLGFTKQGLAKVKVEVMKNKLL